MNGLYPIIRRARRPLVPVEAQADGRVVAAAVQPPVKIENATAPSVGAEVTEKQSDAKTGTNENR